MATVSSPTVRRRELGANLRALRTDAGLTVEQVAERLLCSQSKISRLETGHRGASQRDIRDLCNLYRVVDEAVRDRLMVLAREGKEQAWWQPYDLPYATYVGLEAAAVSISDFESGVFPGLLQTPGYARALHEGAFPPASPEVIDERIEVRTRRQQILEREDPVRLAVVMDEAILHRVVGGPAVMAEQLGHVIVACQQDNVSIQVIPYSAGAHPALDSTFTVLEFPPPVPGVVYVEGLAGQIYLERPSEVERYQQIFAQLTVIAMSPEKSLELMAKAQVSYRENDPRPIDRAG